MTGVGVDALIPMCAYENEHIAISTIPARDLAALSKMDEDILIRIILIVIKLFVEVVKKIFAHTPKSATLADEDVAARVGGIFNEIYKASLSPRQL